MRSTEQYYGKAILSAFIASIVLALAFLVRDTLATPETVTDSTNMVHQSGVIPLLSAIFQAPDQPVVGWLAHFILGGIVGGALFAWLSPHLYGRLWLRGVEFGLLAWLAMMVVGMPMAGFGMFGSAYGDDMLPIATFVLQIVYGAVLGVMYSQLIVEQSLPLSQRIGEKYEATSNQM